MRGNRRRDTGPELRLRRELHRQGLRYRVDAPLLAGSVRVRPDIVFSRARVAVFVDGCFFHVCPQHGNVPRRNTDYWVPKLHRNAERDERVTRALVEAGWKVIRVWEHEEPTQAAAKVAAVVSDQTGSPRVRDSASTT